MKPPAGGAKCQQCGRPHPYDPVRGYHNGDHPYQPVAEPTPADDTTTTEPDTILGILHVCGICAAAIDPKHGGYRRHLMWHQEAGR